MSDETQSDIEDARAQRMQARVETEVTRRSLWERIQSNAGQDVFGDEFELSMTRKKSA